MIQQASRFTIGPIQRIKQEIRQLGKIRLDYLIIAHSDQTMIDELRNSFPKHSVAICELPQSCWGGQGEQLADLVEWIIGLAIAKGIIVVGHSQCVSQASAIQLKITETISLSELPLKNRLGPLLDKVERIQASAQSNEQHFVSALRTIRSMPQLRPRFDKNKRLVQGLFYRADTNAFSVY